MGEFLQVRKPRVYYLDRSSADASPTNPLTPHLLIEDPEDDRSIDHDFLTEAVARFPEDDTVQGALVGAVEDLSRQLARMNMNHDYKPYIMVSRRSSMLSELEIDSHDRRYEISSNIRQ